MKSHLRDLVEEAISVYDIANVVMLSSDMFTVEVCGHDSGRF